MHVYILYIFLQFLLSAQISAAITSITSYLYSIRFRSVQYFYFGMSVCGYAEFP